MTVTEDVVVRLKQLDMDTIHIKLKGKGRIDVCTPMRNIARLGMMIGRIEEGTPIPINVTGRKETEEIENYIIFGVFSYYYYGEFFIKEKFYI